MRNNRGTASESCTLSRETFMLWVNTQVEVSLCEIVIYVSPESILILMCATQLSAKVPCYQWSLWRRVAHYCANVCQNPACHVSKIKFTCKNANWCTVTVVSLSGRQLTASVGTPWGPVMSQILTTGNHQVLFKYTERKLIFIQRGWLRFQDVHWKLFLCESQHNS